MSEPTPLALLELDLDVRLRDLWREAAEVEEWTLDVVAVFLRAAYGRGYHDALSEGERGALMKSHGYPVPGRPS